MKQKYLSAAVALLVLVTVSGGMVYGTVRKPPVRFSEGEALQEEAFELTLKSGLFGGEIYYTLDGSTPTLESEVYADPILIEAGTPVKATVVKAALSAERETSITSKSLSAPSPVK